MRVGSSPLVERRAPVVSLLTGLMSLAGAVAPLQAQLDVSGYALGMASASGGSALVDAGNTQLARARLMTAPSVAALTFDLAYEHIATRSSASGVRALTAPGVGQTNSDWIDADWDIRTGDNGVWRHRLDRASVAYDGSDFSVTVGRQAISWATTLFLTPADPFVPFDPSDPFRVYRAGVDAARLRYFPGPFTEIEVVLRPTEEPTTTTGGTRTTALARVQTSTAGWAWGAWGGAVRDDPAGAVFATGSLGATALRAELAVRDAGDGATVRAAAGVDRYFTSGGRDTHVLVEAQYDGFGVSDVASLFFGSPASRLPPSEMQVLGRWAFAAQASIQIHPLVGVDGLALVNGSDGSVLVAPGVSWSATGAASVRLGFYSGVGSESRPLGVPRPGTPSPLLPGSEYGPVPTIAYLSLTWFF